MVEQKQHHPPPRHCRSMHTAQIKNAAACLQMKMSDFYFRGDHKGDPCFNAKLHPQNSKTPASIPVIVMVILAISSFVLEGTCKRRLKSCFNMFILLKNKFCPIAASTPEQRRLACCFMSSQFPCQYVESMATHIIQL